MSGLTVELVTIGDELLLGYTVDTNGAYAGRRLAEIGYSVVRRTTIGDEPGEIRAAVTAGLERTGAVVTTGGLGPTSDDRSKEAVAAVFGRAMAIDEEHLAWMRARWEARFKGPMPESNWAQASMPVGARKLINNHGSAPGVWLEDERGGWVAMLPGVPREMRGMLDDALIPLLVGRVGVGAARVVRSRTLRTTGVAESLLADMIDTAGGEGMLLAGREGGGTAGAGNPGGGKVSLAYLPSITGVDLRLTVRGLASEVADERLGVAGDRIRAVVGNAVYGEGTDDLASVVLEVCRQRTGSIGVAESCTGGLVGARLTAIPGSSDVFLGGVIAYANSVKREVLGVSEESLRQFGAVSEEVAKEMAAGALRCTGAGIGLSITGIAGPDGGTAEKPVGLVWICVDDGSTAECRELRLWGDREEIRARAAQAVLEMTRRRLLADL